MSASAPRSPSPSPSGSAPRRGAPRTPREDPRLARSRALLLDAASRLLAETGIDAVTVDAVTRAAGVARATLYRHFGSNAELQAAAFERLLPPVAPPPQHGTIRDRLLTLLTDQAELIDHAPLHVLLLSWLGMQGGPAPGAAAPDTEPPHLHALRQRIIEQYREPFDTVLTDDTAQAALDIEPGSDITPALAQLGGPLIFNRLVTGHPNDPAFCARIVDDFLAAHRAHRPAPDASTAEGSGPC